VLAEIQVLPQPSGSGRGRYEYVDAAIAVVAGSGLAFEVHALGTVVEGPPEVVWPLLRRVHEATLAAGASATATVVKVYEAAGDAGPGMAELVAPYR
jgi:uncharacterized protein YqgV (UPF0045/DUF77 family)